MIHTYIQPDDEDGELEQVIVALCNGPAVTSDDYRRVIYAAMWLIRHQRDVLKLPDQLAAMFPNALSDGPPPECPVCIIHDGIGSDDPYPWPHSHAKIDVDSYWQSIRNATGIRPWPTPGPGRERG